VELRGEVTVDSIHRATDVASHQHAVKIWAASVWEAWSRYHSLARTLLGEMTASARVRERKRK
jgi:hypothetical protein